MNILYLILILGIVALSSTLILYMRWRGIAAKEPRVLLTGGGTGGHVNPALAIAEGIKAREPETRFLYVGVRGKAETVIVRRAGYRLLFVCSEGFPGLRLSFRTLRFLCRLSIGVAQSIGILFRFAPRRVIATGGYVSAPVILAAIALKTIGLCPAKIFLHEQNSIPGQLNALLGKWVDRVLLTFPQTLSFFKHNGVVVGYPIRHSIVPVPREEALSRLPFKVSEGRFVIFAFGGSQGARTINRAVVGALRFLLPHRDRLFIIHGTGLAASVEYDAAADTESRLKTSFTPEELSLLDEFYYRQDYFHNIADVYSISDLIICRSGAGSLNEISRMGKPSILVPKANLPGDHQVMNARAMKHAEAAEVLFEDTVMEDGELVEKLEGRLLAARMMRLVENPDRTAAMADKAVGFLRRKATERILSEIYEDNGFDNGVGCDSVAFRALAGNQLLLQLCIGVYNRSAEDYDPLIVVGDEDDLIYYRHRAAGLLSHKAWQDRNLGVKLIGYTLHREKIPTLLQMLSDRTPAAWVKRVCGGDFEQVGFIRRNIIQALQIMNQFDPEVEESLLAAVNDPYFEVRAGVCRAASHFGPLIAGKDTWFEALLTLLNDECFEVVLEAAKAMGEVGTDNRAVEVLLKLKESHYWQVRDAALRGLKRLMDRRVVSPSPDLLSQTACFILTATDFRPHFSIKETYKTLQKCCLERVATEEGTRPDESPPNNQATRKVSA